MTIGRNKLSHESIEKTFLVALMQKATLSGMNLTGKQNFYKILQKLKKEQIINSEEEKQWDIYRELRNTSSHPNEQSIISPAIAINALNSVADIINILFVPKQI